MGKDALRSGNDDKDDGKENISFFDFLDTTKTPEKDLKQQGFKTLWIHVSCSLMNIIEKLVDNNSNLHRLLGDEKLQNKQLQNHVSDLQKELQMFKTTMSAKSTWNACTVLRIFYPRPVSEALTRV